MSHPSEATLRASPVMNGTPSSDCYVVEIFDEMVGLLILEERGCVFHAVIKDAWALDGCVFRTTHDARQAVRELMALKRRGPARSKAPFDR